MISQSQKGRLAIVAHDAGGAEVLSSFVRREKPDCVFYLEGPARAVFARKLNIESGASLEQAIADGDCLLCGTSWQSDLERRAIRIAREQGKQSVAWLDHWVNYRTRFDCDGQLYFPDEIWVSDAQAYDIALKQVPEVTLRQRDNPYFLDIKADLSTEMAAYPALSNGIRVLYVCEPVREHALLRYGDERYWGYTEEEALAYFLRNLQILGKKVGHVLIRRHPSEKAGKYQGVVDTFNLPIEFSHGHTLSSELVASDCVVGCNSMAMVIGLIAGKRVISCIPPGGVACTLPQPEIEHLWQLLAACGASPRM